MHHEVIVKHHGCALFHKAFSVSNAASIWDVATLHIEPLGGVVARMQSDSDPYNTRTPGCFRFCAVQQAACDTFSAVRREHIEVLNLRNCQVSKSGISRSPVYRHVPGELPVNSSDEAGPSSRHLFLEVPLVLGLRLFPPHPLERGSDARRVAFFEKPNLNGLRVFHTILYAKTRLTLNCTLTGVNRPLHSKPPAQGSMSAIAIFHQPLIDA